MFKEINEACLGLAYCTFWTKEIFDDRGPTHPFLLNWRSKYDKRINPDFNIGKISFLCK